MFVFDQFTNVATNFNDIYIVEKKRESYLNGNKKLVIEFLMT